MPTIRLMSSLLVVDESVQGRSRDRRTAFRSPVRDGGQTTCCERTLRLGGPDEADGKTDHERGSNVESEQFEERRRCVPDDPDGSIADLLRSDPEAGRRTRYAKLLGQRLGARVGDEAQCLAAGD